jgi:hypothetical protein
MKSSRIMNEDGAASEQGVEVERSHQEMQSTNRKTILGCEQDTVLINEWRNQFRGRTSNCSQSERQSHST